MANINGGSGNDILNGTSQADVINGGSGNDTLTGGGGNDTLDGGSGNDKLDGGIGDDQLLGGSGDDELNGGAGNDNLDGGSGDDKLIGDIGNDQLSGGAGDDYLDGGANNDVLDGGSGNDTMLGGAGNDTIDAGSGNDISDGGAGSDVMRLGSGNDIAIYRLSENAGTSDQYYGDSGTDTLRLEFTSAEWANAAVRSDVARWVDFLRIHSGDPFSFNAFNLKVENFEATRVFVDGVEVNPTQTTNHAPVAVNDTNGLDAVVEAGNGAGGIPVAGDPSASGNVLSNDTDPDAGDTKAVTTVGSFTGTYGTLTLAADGQWVYQLDNARTQTNALAQGQIASDVFTYTMRDAAGALSSASLTVKITGTNDAAVLSSDVRHLTESNSAAGISTNGVLTISDVDSAATFVAQPGTVGSYGTFAISSSGAWTYTPSSAHNEFAAGVTYTDTFSVASADGTLTSVTVNILGTNDAPVITGGTTTGTVVENSVGQATGSLNAVDPDTGAVLTWTVQGGTSSADADFLFSADSLVITKNGAAFFTDDFSDGNPPPTAPNFTNGTAASYAGVGVGGLQEAGGRLIFDSDNAVLFQGVGTPDPIIGLNAVLRSNINPATPDAGLRSDDDFTMAGVFDLTLPNSPRESYGIRFTDRLVGGPGSPPDQPGDDTIELVVRQAPSGSLVVTLREVDFAADVTTNLQSITLNPPVGADQIRLILTHDASNVGVVHASFEYLSGNVVVGSQSFTQVGQIFGTEPGSGAENWTRAEIIAYAPEKSDSILSGVYGTLNINQAGAWNYSLDNTRAATQNLAAGQTATETFTALVTDQFGASDTETITVTVTGTNDGPVMQTGAVSRTFTEDESSPNLAATGLANFSDVDLIDTHTVGASLQTAVLSSGNPVPGGAAAALAAAMSASLTNAATGDGSGQVSWNFALANSAAQFLGAGETLTATYAVAVTDNHGASATQTVTITIVGTNDAAVLSSDVRHLTESNSAAGISTNGVLTISDVDGAATFVAQAGTVGSYGTFAISSTGAWTYTASSAHNEFAAGVTYTDTFSVASADGTLTSVTVNIVGTNDAAVLSSDVRHLTEGNTAASISTNGVLTISDVDSAATFVAQAGTVGSYGTFAISSSGAWTYTPSSAHNEFAAGVTYTDTFSVASADGTLTSVTVNILGTNDAPVITGGTTTGTVVENSVGQATGSLNAVDPDTGAVLTWTVQGGTSSADADFLFSADSLVITKNGAAFFTDDFSDGNPPPTAPNFTNGTAASYAGVGVGGLQEAGGRLIFDSDNAVLFQGVGTPDPIIGLNAVLRSNINPATPDAGLRSDDDFTMAGVFDLTLPNSPRESYGIRFTDRLVGGPGSPPDQPGDDTIELVVRQAPSGSLVVTLREVDFAADVTTNLQSITLNPPVGADQIRLILTHDASNVGVVHASFEYLSGNVVVGSQSFTQVGQIFGTEPGSGAENWTRAEIIAYAPEKSDSILSGVYGTLNINQAGAWNYSLDNTRAATQNLAAGQTATETFTALVTDQFGASDTETITVTVTGTNDGPVMQTGAVSRTFTEDESSPNLAATGLANFSDVDLIDTHTVGASLQTAVLSSGNPVPGGAAAALAAAMSASLTNAATGDGSGQVSWNFALANSAAQFLGAGETLTATYAVAVTDNHGASATQTVTITIVGTDDAPLPLVSVTATDGVGTETVDGSPDFTFTFSRTGDITDALTVNYSIFPAPIDGADPGSDFPAQASTITFAAGSSTAVLQFDAIDDAIVENTELFSVVVGVGDYNIDFPNASAGGHIIDNDTAMASLGATGGGITTMTAGLGPNQIWASEDAEHFRFTAVDDSAFDIPSAGQRDIITGFDASEDKFVFDGIAGATSVSWVEADIAGAHLVLVDLDGNGTTDAEGHHVGYEMAIQLVDQVGVLTSNNFSLV